MVKIEIGKLYRTRGYLKAFVYNCNFDGDEFDCVSTSGCLPGYRCNKNGKCITKFNGTQNELDLIAEWEDDPQNKSIMTMREAFIKGKTFKFLGDVFYSSHGCVKSIDMDCPVGCKWLFENQDKEVEIIE